MIDEVFPNIFRMDIPLPGNPLKAINSYLIKGKDRFLMVDTGMNRPECMKAMEAGLQELQADLKRTDYFVTHLHADHFGLVSELVKDSCKIYFNHPDAEHLKDTRNWEIQASSAVVNGFPESDLEEAIMKHPGRRYHAKGKLNLTLLAEGDQIPIGNYTFCCVETPGHTNGHMCLYEPKAKILFSGDHILIDITPNISSWASHENPLRDYIASLDKIEKYDVKQVLPGHRSLFKDHHQRIAELKKHHDIRTEEVVDILRQGKQNAYQVASQMTWDIDCDEWEDFPLPQKWFAGGEALAHLQYLQGMGRVKRELQNGKAIFSLQ